MESGARLCSLTEVRWSFRKHPLDDSTSRGVGQPRISASRAENVAYNLNSQLFLSVVSVFLYLPHVL